MADGTRVVNRSRGTLWAEGVAPPPILLHEARGGAQFVTAGCERCLGAGVRQGMSVAQAQALLDPDDASRCVIAPVQRHRDDEALERLATWAVRHAPLVAVDRTGPEIADGLLLDVSGCERLYRNEAAFLRRLERDLARLGLRARTAIASTVGGAWAVARYGGASATVVSEGDLRGTLAPLPIAALRLDPTLVQGLEELEIRRVRDLLPLPRRALATRFGEDVVRRLDQALGRMVEVFTPVRELPLLRVSFPFDGPCTVPEGIERAVWAALQDLAARLRGQAVGVRRLDLVLRRANARALRSALVLSRPSRDARHLRTLLRPRLERADLGFGVERLELVAVRTAPLPMGEEERLTGVPDAGGSTGPSADRADGPIAGAARGRRAGELVDAMVARLGPEAVLRGRPRESHLPEQAFDRSSALESPCDAAPTPIVSNDRPPILFDPPEPCDVILEPRAGSATPVAPTESHGEREEGHGGPPPVVASTGLIARRALRWRGALLETRTWVGPERVLEPWWPGAMSTHGDRVVDGAGTHRDYYRVEDRRGRWWWVYRHHPDRRWFVHGAWT